MLIVKSKTSPCQTNSNQTLSSKLHTQFLIQLPIRCVILTKVEVNLEGAQLVSSSTLHLNSMAIHTRALAVKQVVEIVAKTA